MKPNIAPTIRALIKQSGKTDAEIASESGLHVNTIYKIRSGESKQLSTACIPGLCKALNVNPDTIFDWKE